LSNNKSEIGLPDKLGLYHRGSYIEIVRKWFGWHVIFLTAIVIFYAGFLFMSYSKGPEGGNPMAFYFEFILQVAVGIGLAYYAVAGWLNRTHILVGQGKIAIQHRPIHWLGNKKLNVSDIKQLYAKVVVGGRSGISVTYEVHAATRSGRSIKLVTGLGNSEQAVYIEQEIEKYLNIKNIPVKGEIGR
jgi:hypothetical protein